MFIEQLLNGLTLGGIYALIAVGYTMVYGIIKLINFAHGEIYMLGAYLALVFISAWHVPFGVSFLLSIGCCALTGVLIERIAYRPLRRAPRMAALITAIGVSLTLQNLARMIWGASTRPFPTDGVPEIFQTKYININQISSMSLKERIFSTHDVPLPWSDASISMLQLFIFLVTLFLMLSLRLIVNKTKIGKAMRACSQDMDCARLMGIDVDKVIVFTFALGSCLGGAAGILVGLYYNAIFPTMGYTAGVKAFAAAVLGGIGNITGAVLGALLLGIAEIFGAAYISSSYRQGIAYGIMIIFILFRPSGLLGRKLGQKV